MRAWILFFAVSCLVSQAEAAPGDKEKAAAHYKQGKTFLDAKQYDQAIVEFEAAYAIDKLSSHLFNIARAYDAKQDYEHAIAYYQKYLDAEPSSPRAAEVRTAISVATKACDDAAAKRKAEEDARTAETKRVAAVVHIKQAEAYEQAGAWDKAGDEHRQAFTVDGQAAHLLAAAEAYRKHGDLAKARDQYAAYLDKEPLGATSDATRAKLAEVTREIDKASELANKPPPVEPPKARSPEVVSLASNAATAAAAGNCAVARTLAARVHEQDPAYHDAVVVPGIAACAQPATAKKKRIGGDFEVRFGANKTDDFVEGGMVRSMATLGSKPSPTGTIGFGGSVAIAATQRIRIRAGLRLHAGYADFNAMNCAGVTMCLRKVHVAYVGPVVAAEPALYRDGAFDVHLLLGVGGGFPLGQGAADVENGMGDTMDGMDFKMNTQLEIDAGIGFRTGRWFANLVFTGTPTAVTDDFDIGTAKTFTLSLGLTTLH